MDSAEGNGLSRSIAKSLHGTIGKVVLLIGSWASVLAVFFCMSINDWAIRLCFYAFVGFPLFPNALHVPKLELAGEVWQG